MKKYKISPQFRSNLSEKLMDLGNLIAVSLIFGQFVNGKEFSIRLFLFGLVLTVFCYIISFEISI